MAKFYAKSFLRPFLLVGIPMIIINSIITKNEKRATRVANMLAIKEMGDYRNYADSTGISAKPKVEQPFVLPEVFNAIQGKHEAKSQIQS